MKIIITGATGFLGGWLVSDLLQDSHELIILRYKPTLDYQASQKNPRNYSQYFLKNFDQKCKEIFVDLSSYSSVEKIIKDTNADAVIHMAAVSRVSIAKNNPRHTFELGSNGTLNLLEAIRIHSPNTLFLCHTDHKIYRGNNIPFRENMLFNPDFIFEAAMISKEYLTKIYSQSYKVKGVTIRSGSYFGGYDFNFHRIIPYVIKCLINDKKIELRSDGNITRDFLYIKDAVHLHKVLLNSMMNPSFEFGSSFNFSLENNISVIDIVRKISEIYGKKVDIEIIGGGHPLYKSSELKNIKLDCKKAKEKLMWEPKYTMEEGLRETIDFYKSYFMG